MVRIEFKKTGNANIIGIDIDGVKWGALIYRPATKTLSASCSLRGVDAQAPLWTTSAVPTNRANGPSLAEAKRYATHTLTAR